MHAFLLQQASTQGLNKDGAKVEFKRLVDEYWQWRLREAPEFATTIQVYTYNNRAEQFGIDDLDRQHVCQTVLI